MRLAVFMFMMVLAQTLFAVTASPAEAQEEAFYKFTSEPAGVSVFIDGKLVGKAEPAVSGVIAAGTHHIRAEYPGYSPVDVPLHFKADELIKRNFKLQPSSVEVESLRDSEDVRLAAEVGNLQVVSVPPDLPVTIGGKKIGQNTPCKVNNLAVGEVRVEIDGHGLTTTVKKGVTTKIRYDLKSNTYRQEFPDIGTWTDPKSGLTWQVTPTGGDTSWENAKSHCSRLVLDGGGWRLPTIGELRSLIRGCPATEAGGSCSVKKGACLARSCRDDSCNGCGNFGGPANGCYWPHYIQGACTLYWSSSPVGDDDGYAWHVFFNSGLVYDGYFFVSSGSPVRCVR